MLCNEFFTYINHIFSQQSILNLLGGRLVFVQWRTTEDFDVVAVLFKELNMELQTSFCSNPTLRIKADLFLDFYFFF